MTPKLCTYFDQNYLAKGLALIESLKAHHNDFRLFVLALDEPTRIAINQNADEHIFVTPLELIEDDELRKAKQNRTLLEYYWTLTPYWTRLVLDAFHLPHIAYVDADSFLFNPLDTLYHEVNISDIAIIPHRFPNRLKWREQSNGIYNVNWVYFANTPTARQALDNWVIACLDCCQRKSENGRFGDQMYLDMWPRTYRAHVVQHLGANLAPWNQEQYRYTFEQQLYIGDGSRNDPLLFYHFHEWERPEKRTGYKLREEIIQYVYLPYEDTMTGRIK